MKTLIALFLALAAAAHAGPRNSTHYNVATDTIDGGGQRTASASYTNNGGAGGVVGISTALSAKTAKHGYIAQLTDVTALELAASPATLNEGTTRQITAAATLDDATTFALLATDVTWSVQTGPLTGISASGLATAGTVYQNSIAIVEGVWSGMTRPLKLVVVNVNLDDFGTYAGDGIDDSWQAQHFGLNNPLATPNVVTDGTGLTNLFKFTAGLTPNNSASRFLFDPQPLPGQMRLVISPRLPDRTYTVITSPTLGAGAVWTPLTTFTIDDNGNTRTITDTSATGTRKFYRVEITKP